ncbi:MAG: D-amino-acid transaminase [Acetobacteraceae bacterium]|nr:D-amino-acid transaminase [Acetobacteraceae bacterium]
MSRIAYVDGRYLALYKRSIYPEDRGYQFADSVYEVVHLCNGRMIDESRHLDRLDRSLGALRIPPPMGRAALSKVLRELVWRNRVRDGLVYLQVSRGVARREHAFPVPPPKPTLVATVRRLPPFPTDAGAWAGTAITWPDERWARCDIKSTALLPNVLAKQAARERGAIEAILVRSDDTVTEGSSTNVWIVDENGTLRTRELGHAILPGCTRATLIALMHELGFAFEEAAFDGDALRRAREVFVTSATSFVRPIVQIDGVPVGDGKVGPVTLRLFELLTRHVKGRAPVAG